MKYIVVPVIIGTILIGTLASCSLTENNTLGTTPRDSSRNRPNQSDSMEGSGSQQEKNRPMQVGSGQMMRPEGSGSGRRMNPPTNGSGQMMPPPDSSGGTMELPPL